MKLLLFDFSLFLSFFTKFIIKLNKNIKKPPKKQKKYKLIVTPSISPKYCI